MSAAAGEFPIGSIPARAPQTVNPDEPPAPLDDQIVAAILKGRGLRGLLRTLNIGRVLGLLTLYLFLDSYTSGQNSIGAL